MNHMMRVNETNRKEWLKERVAAAKEKLALLKSQT